MLSIVAGLDEDSWHRSVVPSGWTSAGLVEHLGGAEWHWFQGVVAGEHPEPAPGDEDLTPYDPTAAFVCDQPSAEIINSYRDQCASSDTEGRDNSRTQGSLLGIGVGDAPQTLIRIGTVLEPSTASAGPLGVPLWSIVLAGANPLVSGCQVKIKRS